MPLDYYRVLNPGKKFIHGRKKSSKTGSTWLFSHFMTALTNLVENGTVKPRYRSEVDLCIKFIITWFFNVI